MVDQVRASGWDGETPALDDRLSRMAAAAVDAAEAHADAGPADRVIVIICGPLEDGMCSSMCLSGYADGDPQDVISDMTVNMEGMLQAAAGRPVSIQLVRAGDLLGPSLS